MTVELGGNTLVVLGTFTDNATANFRNPVILNNGTIEARGNVVATTSANSEDWTYESGGTATLVMKGTADQSLTSSLGHLCNLSIDKSAGTVTCSGDLIIGSFTLTNGTFIATTNTMYVKGNWTQASTGTFNPTNGTVAFYSQVRTASPYSISVPATETFNNLSVSSSEDLAINLNGNTVVVLGAFANNGGVNGSNPDKFDNGTLELRGNIAMGTYTAAGTAAVKLTGSGSQTYTSSGGVPPGGTWTIDKSGGAFSLLKDLSLTVSGQQLVWTNGAVDLSSNTLTVAGATTIYPGATTLGVTVADTNKAGRLMCSGAVINIANVGLEVSVAVAKEQSAQLQGLTYTILSNNTSLGVATFVPETWVGAWRGTVAYTNNGGKSVTLSSVRAIEGGTLLRVQ
jgi:hypothetical protein